ncbi:MAG: polysulfide reductase NrfD [Planctomycetes bacterium]|nr:polysulfide reductase NrfD [Planctomycetota bacterium]
MRFKGILFLIIIPLVLVAIGIWAYAQQRLHGDVVTHMRSVGNGGAAWGLYIMFDIFFVGLAATGIAVTSAAHLFRLESVRPISRVAEFLAVLSLGLAGMCVMADQGRPLQALLNLPQYARVMSPFFGSFTLIVGVGLAASAVMLYLGGRGDAAWCGRQPGPLRWAYRLWASGYKGSDRELGRHRLARFWLSFTMFPFIIGAYSTLGLVFGTQGGRPGWFGALRAPSMLVVAGISGLGLLIAISGVLKMTIGARNTIPDRLFSRIGNIMVVLISVFLYILVVETMTERYAGHQAELRVSDAILFGAYAPAFWSMLALLGVALGLLFLQFIRRTTMVKTMILVGVLVNVAALLRRYLVVVPAQTHGHYLDYADGIYVPNPLEFGVIGGVLGIGVLAFVAFMRFFPIIPLHAYYGRMRSSLDPEPNLHGRLRIFLTSGTFLTGVSLAAVGLALSARFGTEAYLDPIVPFSPVLFIIGIVMTIYSAAVYVVAPPG